ncbi:protein kinase, partial [bacterium]|nr:protein kinase [bacterium]
PDNIMINSGGIVKLADLGLARSSEAADNVTLEGSALGTPHYMSPEQVRAEPDLDVRSDIYALGATLYHMLTGVRAFDAPTPAAVIAHHISSPVPSVREAVPDVSRATDSLVLRMMAKDRSGRPQSATALLREIRDILAGKPAPHAAPARPHRHVHRHVARKKRSAAPWIAASVLLVCGAVFLLTRGSDPEPTVSRSPTPVVAQSVESAKAKPPPPVIPRNAQKKGKEAPRPIVKVPEPKVAPPPPVADPQAAWAQAIAEAAALSDAGRFDEATARLEKARTLPVDGIAERIAIELRAVEDARKAAAAKADPTPDAKQDPAKPTPVPTKTGPWVSLFNGTSLAGWTVVKFGPDTPKTAKVGVRRSVLFLDKGDPRTAVGWTRKFPTENYEFAFEFARFSGDKDFMYVNFPVGAAQFRLWFRGWDYITTLAGMGDTVAKKLGRHLSYKNEQWYSVRIRVIGKHVEAWIDKRQILGFDTTSHTQRGYDFGANPVIAAYKSRVALRKMRARRLGSSEKGRTVELTRRVGGPGGGWFDDQAEEGGLLVGLHCTAARPFGHHILTAVQPIFRDQKGAILRGGVYGRGGKGTEFIAKPGYAVGALEVRAGGRVDGLCAIFMRVKDGALDPNDTYKSPWVGGGGGGGTQLGGTGRLIVGIQGRRGNEVDALGLVECGE